MKSLQNANMSTLTKTTTPTLRQERSITTIVLCSAATSAFFKATFTFKILLYHQYSNSLSVLTTLVEWYVDTLLAVFILGSIQKVSMYPLPLASTKSRRGRIQSLRFASINNSAVALEAWIQPGLPVDSIRDAVFTVSPNN